MIRFMMVSLCIKKIAIYCAAQLQKPLESELKIYAMHQGTNIKSY